MFLDYRLENVRQKPMDLLAFLEKNKQNWQTQDRKGAVDLPEIEQILEDKYQSTKHVKGWDEEEDYFSLFTSQSNEKRPRWYLKDIVHTVVSLDIKQLIVQTRKVTEIKAQKQNTCIKETEY